MNHVCDGSIRMYDARWPFFRGGGDNTARRFYGPTRLRFDSKNPIQMKIRLLIPILLRTIQYTQNNASSGTSSDWVQEPLEAFMTMLRHGPHSVPNITVRSTVRELCALGRPARAGQPGTGLGPDGWFVWALGRALGPACWAWVGPKSPSGNMCRVFWFCQVYFSCEKCTVSELHSDICLFTHSVPCFLLPFLGKLSSATRYIIPRECVNRRPGKTR